MKRSFFLSTLLLVFGLTAVHAEGYAQSEFNIVGVMQHTDLEGGCWYLQDYSGKKYEVLGSQDQLQTLHVEGRQVSIMAQKNLKTSSTCMLGQVVKVISILDTVPHPRDPALFTLKVTGTIKKNKAGCYYLQTTKGKKYQVDPKAPAKFRKVGRKYSGTIRVLDRSMSSCNMDGLLVGENPTSSGS